jgi:hypothetical protein
VMRRGQREEGWITSDELIDRWPSHLPSYFE